jgi:glyoxylate reductase
MTGKDLHHATVGIVGLGRIGEAVARRLRGFGCSIQYTGRSGPKADLDPSLGAQFADMDTLLRTSDFVILLCALTEETRGLMNAARLRAMRPDAVLINAGRGELVEQADLATVLRERPTMRAGLDVTTPEPLPVDSPLLTLPNCVVLPHIGSASEATRLDMAAISIQHALDGLDGRPLRFEVPETRLA